MAQAAWESGNDFTLTLDQVAAKSTPVKNKNLTLSDSCQSATLAGGTFDQSGVTSAFLNVIATGYFLTVSGLLFNATGNGTYLNAASTSFQFLQNQLYSNATNAIADGIDADTCNLHSKGNQVDTALFIEGTAILGAVTQNNTLHTFASSLAQTAIESFPDSEGILEGDDTSAGGEADHGHLIRGLTTLYELSADDQALQDYVRSFVAVQYNALMDLANDGSDGYAQSWSGPPEQYTFNHETAAIDVLLGGLVMGTPDSNASSPTGSTPNPSNSVEPMHKINLGAIIGGVIGGIVVLLFLIALAAFVIRQRRRKQNSVALAEPFSEVATRDSIHAVHPAIIPTSTASHIQSEKPSLSAIPRNSSRGTNSVNPSTSALSSTSPAVDGSDQASQPIQNRAEEQRANLGSLIWQLNEFLRGGSHSTMGMKSPLYTLLIQWHDS